jgi:hypothetical protein
MNSLNGVSCRKILRVVAARAILLFSRRLERTSDEQFSSKGIGVLPAAIRFASLWRDWRATTDEDGQYSFAVAL